MELTEKDIENLVEKYGDMVLRISCTYLKDKADAEDVLQDLFLQIVDKKPVFHDEKHEKFWIVRATINLCKNRLKLFWSRNRCSMDELSETPSYDKYSTDTAVFNAVMALSRKYRIVIYMFYYEGYSTEEIAKLTGKNGATVRSLLHRARKQLQEKLKEEYDFE